jgi:hypothetical protein
MELFFNTFPGSVSTLQERVKAAAEVLSRRTAPLSYIESSLAESLKMASNAA